MPNGLGLLIWINKALYKKTEFLKTLTESPHHLVHPIASLPAGRALTARLVLVEGGQPGDGLDHVGLLVHHDHGGGAEAGLRGHQGVKVHEDVVANAEN